MSCPQPAAGSVTAHLARGGVHQLGVTVHGTSQHQSAVLVRRQAGERSLVAILTWFSSRKSILNTLNASFIERKVLLGTALTFNNMDRVSLLQIPHTNSSVLVTHHCSFT